jgi:hypothetical protein
MPYDDIHDTDDFDLQAQRNGDEAGSPRWSPISHRRPRPLHVVQSQPASEPIIDVIEPGESARPTADLIAEHVTSNHSATAETANEIKESEPRGLETGYPVPDALAVSAPIPPVTDPIRNAIGRYVRGNPGPVTHGLHSKRLRRVMAEERIAFEQASIAEDGGAQRMSERRKSLHRYRAALHVQLTNMQAAIETHGLYDTRGKLRAAWINAMLAMMSRAQSLDQALGLDSTPRNINALLSPGAWLELNAQGTAQAAPGSTIDRGSESVITPTRSEP